MRNSLLIVAVLLLGIFTSCSSGDTKQTDTANTVIEEVNGFDYLIKHLERNTDVINSSSAPWVIKAEAVHKELSGNIHLVDLRNAADYKNGHIEGAVNVDQKNIINYLIKDIIPSKIDKIILVDNTGNQSAYVASMLRHLGYANIHALKFGMSGWNNDYYQQYWGKVIDASKTITLDTNTVEKAKAVAYPHFPTCESTCAEALEKRCIDLLNIPYTEKSITTDELMANTDNYYIISYWPEKLYKAGHIKGAVNYLPKQSLKRTTDLKTLPLDKTIVVYCYGGHHSAAVAAFLTLLGYDSKTLEYGANSFMHKTLKTNNWKPLLPGNLKNYPYTK